MKRIIVLGLAVLTLLGGGYALSSHALFGSAASAVGGGQQQRHAAEVSTGGAESAVSGPASSATGAEKIKTVVTQADFSVVYTDVAQLAKRADAIVRGRVLSTKYMNYNENVWTVCSVKVTKSWSPNVKEGDTVTVVEEGGITSEAYLKKTTGRPLETPISTPDEQTKVQVLLEGAPLPLVGDESVYFLTKGEWDMVPSGYYDVLGTFQGKFKVARGAAQRYAPEGWSPKYRAVDRSAAALEGDVLGAPKKGGQ